jgi:hypothetical protein
MSAERSKKRLGDGCAGGFEAGRTKKKKKKPGMMESA